jgi:hypothetical protein
MGKRRMRRFVVGAGAAVTVVALAGPAGAAPTGSKNAITFPDTFCSSLTGGPAIVTDFVVNGGGRGGAHTAFGEFQPLALEVTFNGDTDPKSNFIKNNVGKSEYFCQGETTFDTPEGQVTIAFAALGQFKP